MATTSLTPEQHTALWNQFRNGDRQAYARIYELFAADLYRYGFNLVRDKQLVEDSLHELFLHLHHHKGTIGSTDNIRFYLFRALRNNMLRSLQKAKKYNLGEDLFENSEFAVQSFETEVIEEQTLNLQKKMVMSELDKLPKRQKEIIYLVYLKGLTYQEAAEVMEISIKSVYNTVNVALGSLRNYINKSAIREGVFWLSTGLMLQTVFPIN